jgi:23S rRNA (pseudouridine1915-N3)-methyltransferase
MGVQIYDYYGNNEKLCTIQLKSIHCTAFVFSAGILLFCCMKLLLLSFGKAHEQNIREGIEDFTRRIGRYYPVSWVILPPPKNAASLGEADYKKKEAETLLAKLEKDDYLVCLDERGQMLTSEKFAQLIAKRANESVKRLVFLIGGAYGVDPVVLQRAQFTWSLSALVFPHQLVRLILAEQVYRACSILANEKYHHA